MMDPEHHLGPEWRGVLHRVGGRMLGCSGTGLGLSIALRKGEFMKGDRSHQTFIFMRNQGFIFGCVPKVASTNWKRLFRQMSGYENWRDSRLAHDRRGGLEYLDLASRKGLMLLTGAGIRRYTMVRDPYHRALSAYLNKVESRWSQQGNQAQDYFSTVATEIDWYRKDVLDPELFPELTFEVFLLWLRDSGSHHTLNQHFVSQAALLRAPLVRFDIIGRFENLEVDARRILDDLGCELTFPSQHRTELRPREAKSNVATHINPMTRSLVEQVYSEDFKSLDYSVIP